MNLNIGSLELNRNNAAHMGSGRINADITTGGIQNGTEGAAKTG